MPEANPRQLAAELLNALPTTTDPLGALEQVLPWLVWMGSSARSEATGEILLRARDAAAGENTDQLAQAILVWHDHLTPGRPIGRDGDPERLNETMAPLIPPKPWDSREAKLERSLEPFAGLPPRDWRRIGHIIFRLGEEWRACGSDQRFFQFVANLPYYLGFQDRDAYNIEDDELLSALTQIQEDRDRERWSENKVATIPAPERPPEHVREAEETIRLLFQAARDNGWSERDALMWLTAQSTYFPEPGQRGVDHLDKPEFVAERARNAFGIIW